MQTFLFFNKHGDPTAKRFVDETSGMKFRYFNEAGGCEDHSGFVQDGDRIIRWGCTASRELDEDGRRVINTRESLRNSTQKIKMQNIFIKAGIPAPKNSRDISEFDASEYPLLLRRSGSTGGENILVIERPVVVAADNSLIKKILVEDKRAYVTQFWDKDQEFRVHVVNKQPIFQTEKIPRKNPRRAMEQSVWNVGELWMYGANTDVEARLADVSVAAVDSLGLNFGAVDLMCRGDEVKVLEVNTAPGLQKRSRRAYREAMAEAGWLS